MADIYKDFIYIFENEKLNVMSNNISIDSIHWYAYALGQKYFHMPTSLLNWILLNPLARYSTSFDVKIDIMRSLKLSSFCANEKVC